MQIRSAIPKDKPAIIDLLKKSLGESTIPKSEALWDWKHEQNPFGASFVLVAEENEKLIGLRAFMQWEWLWRGHTYKAIRAVDTATHPEHQGKGIFKKLTLYQIEICRQQGVSFVFNTPNHQSKPGYLKMGWVEQGRLPLKFKLLRPLSLAYSKILNEKKFPEDDLHASPKQVWGLDLAAFKITPLNTDQVCTHVSSNYISWRYENNPLFRYSYISDNVNFLLIFRIKKHSFASELRIVEFILLSPDPDSKKLNKQLSKLAREFCKANKIDFISISGLQYSIHKDCFNWMGIIPVRALGPSITLKDLNMKEKFSELLEIKNWNYSLGDLELF
jgi:GNAT superfamily N-acetyltransferase